MNKILKWILGIFPALGGIITAILLGSKKSKKIKELETKSKKVKKRIDDAVYGKEALEKTLKSKEKALKEMKKDLKRGYKKKEVGADEATDFLKKYVKKKKK
tara:strand:+ start:36 stop:341 length:306 start_codon:yes stop_codon:yes gene_type:complete